jgi:Fe-S cluster assembly protein SufB
VTKINYAAVVELIALDDAEKIFNQPTKLETKEGKGGVYNFVTKRGFARKTQKYLGHK